MHRFIVDSLIREIGQEVLLNQEESEQKLLEEIVRRLIVYRQAIERTLIAPFGSVVLFEAKELQLLVGNVLRNRIRQRADAMLGIDK